MTIQSARYKLRIVITPSGPSPLGIALPFDSGNVVYEYRYDSQAKIAAHWNPAGSSTNGNAPMPQVQLDVVAGPILRWPIRETDAFGDFFPPAFTRMESGVWDVDVLIRFPSSWLAMGQLPKSDPGNGGYWCDFGAMKLFRLRPVGQSGHNATLFGDFRSGKSVYLRDFSGDKLQPKPEEKVIPDQWRAYRIRSDFGNQTIGLWSAPLGGSWKEVLTVPGGVDPVRGVDVSESCGPIFHATTRKIGPPDGGHYLPTYVDFHSYRVIQR